MDSSQMNLDCKPYFNAIMNSIESCYNNSNGKMVVYLEGGHFNSGFGADDFSLNTLKDAVEIGSKILKKYSKNIKLAYGILIDDLGMACSEDVCTIAEKNNINNNKISNLPQELESIFANSKFIKRDKILIFSERTSKNRSINSIKKILKNENKIFTIEDYDEHSEIKICTGETSFLLARRQGHIFTAKCPAIMSQHYIDVIDKLKNRFSEIEKFIIIDWSDISDKNKVTQGKFALSVIREKNELINSSIINVFFGDDDGNIVQLDK